MKPQDIKESPKLELPIIQTKTFLPEKSFTKQHMQTFQAISIARQHPVDLNKKEQVSEVEKSQWGTNREKSHKLFINNCIKTLASRMLNDVTNCTVPNKFFARATFPLNTHSLSGIWETNLADSQY